MYNGDFSKWVTSAGAQIPIYNPADAGAEFAMVRTRARLFPGNVIPQSLFSPAAVKALGVFQTSGMLAPNNGAAPGTPAYVTEQLSRERAARRSIR